MAQPINVAPDGSIEITSSRSITLIVGGNRVVIDPKSIRLESTTSVEISGPYVEISATSARVDAGDFKLDTAVTSARFVNCETLTTNFLSTKHISPGAERVW